MSRAHQSHRSNANTFACSDVRIQMLPTTTLWCGLTEIITPEQERDRSNESGVVVNQIPIPQNPKIPEECLRRSNIGGMLIRNVPFGLVVEGEREIYENTFDGVIGLGRRSMCLEQTQPLIQSIHRQGLISRKFGFHFQKRKVLICKLIWFFERPACNLAESFVCDVSMHLNVLRKAARCFSRYDIRHIAIHVHSIFICKLGLHTQNHRMIFDTGARAIHLPGDIHMAINDMLKMKTLVDGEHVFDCEMLHFLPPIAFQIQGKMFQIFPKQYTIQKTIGGDTKCWTVFYNVSDKSPAGIILGMSFLHSFQLLFDDHLGRIGFIARHGKSRIF
ncbi:hypothetical protein T265_09450 [Opisthorchis viverrini]|uniref:Peptidase A1 domain-containing protein n=1 Tax=Opisthorchis viverrini TaxID=6198 RepID=A0A074ZGV7_OPIVI|nr:hypothetical protein T265_09450 [Opisthorchis viverrini]KER22475.1 hypothetical protein T265_09450 [Opisthorchis viverrini]